MFGLFVASKGVPVALVDVSSSSVRAAYALIVKNAQVRIVFETKVPIDVGSTTTGDAPMLRALDEALRDMRAQGAPLLRKITGSGSAEHAFASVCAPWQKASLRIEARSEEKPFAITEGFIREALGKSKPMAGHVLTEEAVVATLLNGYETRTPIGKRASRAEIIVLSASMGEETHAIMSQALRSFASSHEARFSSFASVAFRAIQTAFPHEKDYLTIRVSGEATELTFVKGSLPMSTAAVPIGVNAFSRAAKKGGISAYQDAPADASGIIDREKSEKLDTHLKEAELLWTKDVGEALRLFAAAHALPRTVFLVADDEAMAFLSRLLNSPDLHRLWLSDEPLSIIPLVSLHFGQHVIRDTHFPRNVPIDLLALHARTLID